MQYGLAQYFNSVYTANQMSFIDLVKKFKNTGMIR